MNNIGIMQGRLLPSIDGQIQVFPGGDWVKEFGIAGSIGLDCIEWIYDKASENTNPIINDQGIEQILEQSDKYNVKTRSLCADYFMVHPLYEIDNADLTKTKERMLLVLEQAKKINVGRVVIPFVDSSSINSDKKREDVTNSLNELLQTAKKLNIELHLETDLSPADFKNLLDYINDPFIKVNYDSGNSASLGYKPDEEFSAYGDRIGSVHIKDRILNGTTVPLGRGDADFVSLFNELRKIEYAGDIILQVARGTDGDEAAWTKSNLEHVKRMLK